MQSWSYWRLVTVSHSYLQTITHVTKLTYIVICCNVHVRASGCRNLELSLIGRVLIKFHDFGRLMWIYISSMRKYNTCSKPCMCMLIIPNCSRQIYIGLCTLCPFPCTLYVKAKITETTSHMGKATSQHHNHTCVHAYSWYI